MNKPCLEFKKVNFSYSDEKEKQVLKEVSFSLKKGEIISILGENGAGKSTILNLISDFNKPTNGKIIKNNGSKIFSTIIPQEYSLLEWKTVAENIELSMLSLNMNEKEMKEKINELIELLNLQNYANKLPSQLSGGLKQRTAIARALAPNPELLLLDEPFSFLDAQVKKSLLKDIKKIIKSKNKSAIFVTHDVRDAVILSDKIFFIKNNKLKRYSIRLNQT